MRVLTTGSRNWPDENKIHKILDFILDYNDINGLVFVHGGCPTGADNMVYNWCVANGVEQEIHKAEWNKHGRSAGPIRNQEMVDLGADFCLAFIHGDSRGTRDCARRARRAGIEVNEFTLDNDDEDW